MYWNTYTIHLQELTDLHGTSRREILPACKSSIVLQYHTGISNHFQIWLGYDYQKSDFMWFLAVQTIINQIYQKLYLHRQSEYSVP